MSIPVGSRVPDTAVEAYMPGIAEPAQISLSDYHGSWVVLFFYPRDFTFVCPTELVAFSELAHEFAAEGAAVIAASTDSYWSHRAWFERDPMLGRVAFPVLADTTHAMSEAFGVLVPDGSALRGTFLIDADGVVRASTVVDQSVGRNADETLRTLQALRTGELCPAYWRPGTPTLKAA
jgi:alkyl hydroperoxide reductase subunit AhpC